MSTGTGRTPSSSMPSTSRSSEAGATGDSSTPRSIDPRQTPASTPRVVASCSGQEIDNHLEKCLECPVCYEVILPPIFCCVRGHSCCESCRSSLNKCPVCRGDLANIRNLFAEQLLEKFQFMCKFGCPTCLPAQDLANHYDKECGFRPIYCRECDEMIPYQEFLNHVQDKDKLERQNASECSTGFEIDEDDLVANSGPGGRRYTVWEPTWMYCYEQDFFCSLDYNGSLWWLWVSSLAKEGWEFKCKIILWSKKIGAEHSYYGTIHSVRTSSGDVLKSGKCLILTESALKNFMCEGGVDILVRIEEHYLVPKTRLGNEVQSPLEITDPTRPRKYPRSQPQSQQQPQNDQGSASRATTRVLRSGAVRNESRIPISVTSPQFASPSTSRLQSSGTSPNFNPGRRLMFENLQPLVGTSGNAVPTPTTPRSASGMRARTARANMRSQGLPPFIDLSEVD